MVSATSLVWWLGCAVITAEEPGAAPLQTPAAAEEATPEAPTSPIRFVLANTYGLNFGLTPVPSGEATLFLGASLPIRPWRPTQWLALGYHGAIAGGSADAPGFAASTSLFVHRHRLAILGTGGAKGRLAYGLGVGVVMTAPQRIAPGLEAEGRLGYLFGRPEHRNQGIVGAQLRVSGSLEHSPWPQVGVFIGLVHAPFARQTGGATVPPNGLGLLAPGVMLVASGVLTAVSSGIALAARGGSGTRELWSYTAPYTAASLILGVPLVAVGAVRLRKYRAYRVRMGGGFAIDF